MAVKNDERLFLKTIFHHHTVSFVLCAGVMGDKQGVAVPVVANGFINVSYKRPFPKIAVREGEVKRIFCITFE